MANETQIPGVPSDDQVARLPALRILVAGDSQVNQQAAVALLKPYGHTVTVVCSGTEALAAWRARRYDVVLLDVGMPENGGLETAATIRRREARTGGHVPMIAIGAQPELGPRALAAGIDAWVGQPLRADELLGALTQVLGRAEAAAIALAWPGGDVVDWPHALEVAGGDVSLLRSITEAFLGDHAKLVDQLRRAVTGGDAKALRVSAHAIKGSIRYFGAQAAYDLAFDLETLGREGRLDGAERVLSSLIEELDRVVPPLRQFFGSA